MRASKFQDLRRSIERQFHDQPSKVRRALNHLVMRNALATIVMDRRVIGWRMSTGEIVCVKARYSTEQLALKSMSHIVSLQDSGRIPVRVYQCDYCLGWHMTSQKLRVKL